MSNTHNVVDEERVVTHSMMRASERMQERIHKAVANQDAVRKLLLVSKLDGDTLKYIEIRHALQPLIGNYPNLQVNLGKCRSRKAVLSVMEDVLHVHTANVSNLQGSLHNLQRDLKARKRVHTPRNNGALKVAIWLVGLSALAVTVLIQVGT